MRSLLKSTIPQLDREGMEALKGTASHKVLRSESQAGQGLSIPTIPSIPNDKTLNEEANKTEKESINNNGRGQIVEGIAGVEKQEKMGNTENYTHQKTVTIPPKKEINWSSYPYNSSDRYNQRSRRLLSDSELIEFWQYLKQECQRQKNDNC